MTSQPQMEMTRFCLPQTAQKTSQSVLEPQGVTGFQSGLSEINCNWKRISCTVYFQQGKKYTRTLFSWCFPSNVWHEAT